MKILHLADPHIDSPLRGLGRYTSLPVEDIRLATRRAFANAVDFALDDNFESELDKALHRAAKAAGFVPAAHRLDLFGTCANCS